MIYFLIGPVVPRQDVKVNAKRLNFFDNVRFFRISFSVVFTLHF